MKKILAKTVNQLKGFSNRSKHTGAPNTFCDKRKSQNEIRNILRNPQIQPKLSVGTPDDVHEKEVERVADEIATVPGVVHDVVNSPGAPLDGNTNAYFEPRFGHDFSHVRIHSGSTAALSARQVSAKAYAIGSDIVFGAGEYQPGNAVGRKLLAHELAHIVQFDKGEISREQIYRHIEEKAPVKPPEPNRNPEETVDCVKKRAEGLDCRNLIAEMIRVRWDKNENEELLKKLYSEPLPWDQDVIDVIAIRSKLKADLQKKYKDMERVLKECCPGYEMPPVVPPAVPMSAPSPSPQTNESDVPKSE